MKPTLLILAAGIGSRYGGLKQVEPIGPNGEVLLDYAVYDALQAGFGKVVFVITRALERDFRSFFEKKYQGSILMDFAFQDMDKIPGGFSVPPDRTKPWGTGHAVLVARNAIQEPFAVINSDDYYGSRSFAVLGKALSEMPVDSRQFVMVGFNLEKTLSEHGYVARGVCAIENGLLRSIVEREKIRREEGRIIYESASGDHMELDRNTKVSMNCWGFSPDIFFPLAEAGFREFMRIRGADPKAEFYLPSIVNQELENGGISVRVLDSGEQWFGMTYQEDRTVVKACIRERIGQGIYPEKLF